MTDELKRKLRIKSRRAFLAGGLAGIGGISIWKWIGSRRQNDGVPWPLRSVLEINEQLWRDYFGSSNVAETFSRGSAEVPRENGDVGLEESVDASVWRLEVFDVEASAPMRFTLQDIQAFPKVDMATELRCIEGWSYIVHWTGTRFSTLMDEIGAYSQYVSLETPDSKYYVGLDIDSAVHPQTLLCYEMNGRPLTPEHGAPLRLVVPVKYGIKNIKRIGAIRFTNRRAADYWAERGYDWYAGL